MAARARFPLPRGYFSRLQFAPEEIDDCRRVVKDQVHRALDDEFYFVHTCQSQVDETQWRQVRQKQPYFQIFRRRSTGSTNGNHAKSSLSSRTSATRQSGMFGFGQIEGSLDDVLHGMYDESSEEMLATKTFVSDCVVDAAVLATIDTATSDDPFRFLGIKWMLTKLPMLKARDLCYLSSMGTSHDRYGTKYGYLVMHSVNVQACQPFHRNDALRAQVSFTFIFREQVEGLVDVFVQGSIDTAGEMTDRFSAIATDHIVASVFKSVECAETKKLTCMALSYTYNLTHQPEFEPPTGTCKMCKRKGSVFAPLKACGICSNVVCGPCRTKKLIFAGVNLQVTKVTCCLTCVVAAKFMQVRPAEEEFTLSGKYFLPPRADSLESPQSNSKRQALDDAASIGNYDDDDDVYEYQNKYDCEASGVSEDYFDVMMVCQKRASQHQLSLLQAAVPPIRTNKSLASLEHDQLFQQLVALHHKSKQVSAMTRANHRMMQQLC